MNKESLAEQRHLQRKAKEFADSHFETPAANYGARSGFFNGAQWMQEQFAARVEEEAARLAAEVSALREEVAELNGALAASERFRKEDAMNHIREQADMVNVLQLMSMLRIYRQNGPEKAIEYYPNLRPAILYIEQHLDKQP